MEREINILRDLETMLCKEEWKNYLIQNNYLLEKVKMTSGKKTAVSRYLKNYNMVGKTNWFCVVTIG